MSKRYRFNLFRSLRLEQLEDRHLLATFIVNNTDDSGAGSLRQAILDSNTSVGVIDIIEFAIPGTGPHTIQVGSTTGSPLPAITDRVTIDGYTQGSSTPGDATDDATANTNATGQGLNNVIKIALDGSSAGTGADGLRVTGAAIGTTVRGLAIGDFSGDGIELATIGNFVTGSFIGTDANGASRPNGQGIHVTANGNTIGGTNAADRNLLSANTGAGVFIDGSSNNIIRGNLIGTDTAGNASLGNGAEGVSIVSGSNNTVGDGAGAENVISANGANGVVLVFANGNTINGNKIGTDVAGASNLGNTNSGVFLFDSSNNTIGGAGTGGNLIAFNQDFGVVVAGSSTGNAILSNSIHSNDSLGIDHDNTVGTNPNHRQPYPVLQSVFDLQPGTHVAGTLNSQPNRDYRLEFFASAAADPSGFGEGQTFLGSQDVMTNGTGSVDFSGDLPAAPAGQAQITATATDLTTNDTSEFSAAVEIVEPVLFVVTSTVDRGPGSLRQAILDANANAAPDEIHFDLAAVDPGHFYYMDDGAAGQITVANIAVTTEADDDNIAAIDPDWPHSWWTIAPQSLLPALTDAVVIDGYSQTGAQQNTNPVGQGLNTVLRVELVPCQS